MRLFIPIAAAAGLVTLFPASEVSAYEQGLIFGRYHVYEGAWCARQDTGGGRIDEDCTFDSFEACRRLIVAGNRGFCSPNPAFTGYDARPARIKRRIAR